MYLHPFNSFLKNNFATKRGGDSRACHSKANKQAGLVERNIYFISDASNWWPVAGWGRGKQEGPQTLTKGEIHHVGVKDTKAKRRAELQAGVLL